MRKKLRVQKFEPRNLPTIWVTRVGDFWVTQSDYLIDVPVIDAKMIIPLGFQFDLASVPRWAWWLIAPFELSIIAPLVHDYLYGMELKKIGGNPVTRKDADDAFLALMLIEGIPKWKANLAHRAVRLASWIWWQPSMR